MTYTLIDMIDFLLFGIVIGIILELSLSRYFIKRKIKSSYLVSVNGVNEYVRFPCTVKKFISQLEQNIYKDEKRFNMKPNSVIDVKLKRKYIGLKTEVEYCGNNEFELSYEETKFLG